MTTLPRITVKYAWDTGRSTGATYDTPADARANAPYSPQLHTLLRLYVDPNGRIVHTVEVPS